MDYQRIILIGNSALNAVVKQNKESSSHSADFTVVVRNRRGEAAYYPIRCFGKLAELKHLKAIGMGTRIFVEGVPDISTHTAKDGTERISFRVIATSLRILSSGRRPKKSKPPSRKAGKSEMSDEDLPF